MDLSWKTHPKQLKFIQSKARYLGFIGGVGTGKSQGLVMKGIVKALRNPGSVGMITSPTYSMLRDSTKRTFLDICPPELIQYRNDSENVIGLKAPKGRLSEVIFRSTSEPEFLRGPNLLWVGMDEASISSKESMLLLMGRIRQEPEEEQQLFLATTPKGMNYIYEFGQDEEGRSMGFGPHISHPLFEHIYVHIDDNPFLSKQYVDSLKAVYSGSFAQQELEGKFVAHEGLVYGDLFNPELHVGNIPFNPKLPVDLAWDFGYPRAEAVLAIQQDGNGHVYIIDEIYRLRTLTEDIVAELRARPYFPNIIDCICDEARPDQILRLANLGIPARPSEKGKILDGISKVRSLLSIDDATQVPILHINQSCEMIIKEFNIYAWKDNNRSLEEWKTSPIDAWNDCMDAFRYWVVSKWFPIPTAADVLKKKKPERRVMGYQLLGR